MKIQCIQSQNYQVKNFKPNFKGVADERLIKYFNVRSAEECKAYIESLPATAKPNPKILSKIKNKWNELIAILKEKAKNMYKDTELVPWKCSLIDPWESKSVLGITKLCICAHNKKLNKYSFPITLEWDINGKINKEDSSFIKLQLRVLDPQEINTKMLYDATKNALELAENTKRL